MFNPRRMQRQTTPLRMLPSTSARITRSLTDSTDFIIIIIIIKVVTKRRSRPFKGCSVIGFRGEHVTPRPHNKTVKLVESSVDTLYLIAVRNYVTLTEEGLSIL